MNILAFETATPSGGVALLIDGNVVAEVVLDDAQSHSRLCLVSAENILRDHKLTWQNIDVFATSHGPGSFTGVRVGITLAKSLAFAAGKKVYTVCSLTAIALNCYDGEDVSFVAPMIDARMNEVYGAVYPVTDRAVSLQLIRGFLLPPDDVSDLLEGSVLLAGEGARRYADVFVSHGRRLAEPSRLLSSAAATGRLAHLELMTNPAREPAEIAAVYWRDAVRK